MQKIEISGLSIIDFQRMLEESQERAIAKYLEGRQAPSDYEELTLEQAAQELHCCEATIRRKMLELNISGSKVGKRIVLQRKDLKRIKKAS